MHLPNGQMTRRTGEVARKRQRPTRSEDFTTGRARRGSSASSGGPSQRHGPSASLGGPSQSHGPPASLGGSTPGHTSAPGRRGGASGSEDTYPQSESSSEELEDTQEPTSKRRKQGEAGLSGLPCFDPAELVRSREGPQRSSSSKWTNTSDAAFSRKSEMPFSRSTLGLTWTPVQLHR